MTWGVIKSESESVDNDFTYGGHSESFIGIQGASWEDSSPYGGDFLTNASITWEIWPQPDYRVVIDALQIWNICPPTSTEFGT